MQPGSDLAAGRGSGDGGGGGGWERLHPLSPVLHAWRLGGVLVVLGLQNAAGLSGAGVAAIAAVVAAGVALFGLYSYVSWRTTGFRTTADEVELRRGVFVRSHRRVPLARLEAVDIRRPVVARIFGLAEVRVEVVSQGDSEVALQYLADADAVAVRRRIADLAAGGDTDAPAADGADVRAILQVPSPEIVLGYGVAPVALALLASVPTVAATLVEGGGAATGFVIFAGFATVLLPAVRRLDGMLNFRLGESPGALHIERGMLSQLTQRVNVGRVQAVRIEEPALWRLFGRGRLLVDVAGYRGGEGQEDAQTAVLLPIGPLPVVEHLLDRLPEATATAGLTFAAAPERARWRSPLWWRRHQVAVTDRHTVVRSGLLRRTTDIVPHEKLQSVRVTDGPWQRRLGLATLRLDTAGARVKAAARHRSADDAVALAFAARRRV